MSKRSKPEYQKAYKDQKRVVAYVDPIDKDTLAQEATDRGVSLSALVGPAIHRVAKLIREKKSHA